MDSIPNFEDAIAAMRDTNLRITGGLFYGPADLGSLSVYNSSEIVGFPFTLSGRLDNTSWADGSGLVTLPLFASGNAQLSTVGLQVSATCSKSSYNRTIYVPERSGYSAGPEANLMFNYEDVDPSEHKGLPYELSCKDECGTSVDQTASVCLQTLPC